MTLQIVPKEDCSTIKNCGLRKSDRRKLEDRKKERSKEKKEIIRTIRGHKYRYLIYWDKRPKEICLGRIDI